MSSKRHERHPQTKKTTCMMPHTKRKKLTASWRQKVTTKLNWMTKNKAAAFTATTRGRQRLRRSARRSPSLLFARAQTQTETATRAGGSGPAHRRPGGAADATTRDSKFRRTSSSTRRQSSLSTGEAGLSSNRLSIKFRRSFTCRTTTITMMTIPTVFITITFVTSLSIM